MQRSVRDLLQECGDPASVALIGLGNSDRADDGIGIGVAEALCDQFPQNVFSENRRTLEGIVFDLVEREEIRIILFLDATHFSGEPGSIQLFNNDDAQSFTSSFTTHKVPITLLMDVIQQKGKESYLIGIQPGTLHMLAPMSNAVQETFTGLTALFESFYAKKGD